MLLGKRQRHPVKRTTSMTEMTFDLNTTGVGAAAAAAQSDPQNPFNLERQPGHDGLDHQRFLAATASPRNFRRNSAEFVETTSAHFLRSCSLCKRRLVPGRDIYMYRYARSPSLYAVELINEPLAPGASLCCLKQALQGWSRCSPQALFEGLCGSV